jgi:hypothetical protein
VVLVLLVYIKCTKAVTLPSLGRQCFWRYMHWEEVYADSPILWDGVLWWVLSPCPLSFTQSNNQLNYYLHLRFSSLAKSTWCRGNQLVYREKYTAVMVQIDVNAEGFEDFISIREACDSLLSSCICSCTTDCVTSNHCPCRALGLPFMTRCHKGRGRNKCCTNVAEDVGDDEEAGDSPVDQLQ